MLYDRKNNRILLSEEQDVLIPELNIIEIEGKTFELRPLNEEFKKSKGGNSSVFILRDPLGEQGDQVIKISNYSRIGRSSPEWLKRRYGRFINEIDALKQVKTFDISSNVISIGNDGMIEIDGLQFPYYTMEKADSDLKKYLIDDKNELDYQEKLKMCRDIFNGIKTLHQLNFYHRDIKPDNIFLFYEDDEGGEGRFVWKVGDLGLVAHRDSDFDGLGEKIGPFGWLSPEAMNKFLTERAAIGLDCVINESSDIFQLGKLFWFIFKLNVPIGQILQSDFDTAVPHSSFIYKLIFHMLQYSKERRIVNTNVDEDLSLLSLEFGI